MEIENFVSKSEGEWSAMRSGHSLAFKHFEAILSTIQIRLLNQEDSKVKTFLGKTKYSSSHPVAPFEMKWNGESDWDEANSNKELKGSAILIPIETTSKTGIILRSQGYAEKIQAVSNYLFLADGTLILSTSYEQTVAEERIWFVNKNVRCRSSVIKSLDKKSILQTSFSSEVRKIVLK